jgi:coproporphyrinogen III oxidase
LAQTDHFMPPPTINRFTISEHLQLFEEETAALLTKADGKGFFEEKMWNRREGGGGSLWLFRNANLFQKAGMDLFEIHGHIPEPQEVMFGGHGEFYAAGHSLACHPHHPQVPTLVLHTTYVEPTHGQCSLRADIILLPATESGKEDLDKWLAEASNLLTESSRHTTTCRLPHRQEALTSYSLHIDDNGSREETGKTWLELERVLELTRSKYLGLLNDFRAKAVSKKDQVDQSVSRARLAEYLMMADREVRFRLTTGCPGESFDLLLPPEASWPV